MRSLIERYFLEEGTHVVCAFVMCVALLQMAAGVKLSSGPAPLRPPGLVTAPTISTLPATTAMSARMQMNDAREKAQRAAELQQQIQASLRNAGIGVPRPPAPAVAAAATVNNV